MFSRVNDDEGGTPTEVELERLRRTEYTAQLNSFILEVFDMVAGCVFVVVLFDLGTSFSLPTIWYALGVKVCSNATAPQTEDTRTTFYNLAFAAACFYGAKVLFRLLSAIWQIVFNYKRFKSGVKHVFLTLAGIVLTIAHPKSGCVLLEQQFHTEDDGVHKLEVQYKNMVKELRSDWTLLFLETLPWFIIQIIYAVLASRNANYGLPPAWFVAILTTAIKILGQLQEAFFLQLGFSRFKALAKKGQLLVGKVEYVLIRPTKVGIDISHDAVEKVSSLVHHPPTDFSRIKT